MTKKLKLLILLLVVASAAFGLFYRKSAAPQTPKNEAVLGQATLVMDYGDGKRETVSFAPQPDQTVFDTLKLVAEEKKIALEIQQYDFGVFVKTIGGYKSSAEMAWIYFVNGTAGTIAADKQAIKAGDLIEWKYIKPE